MTYVDVLIVALSGGLLAYFYNSLMDEGMLLEKLKDKLEGRFWLKPLGGCAYCTVPYLTVTMLLLWLYVPVAWEVITVIVAAYFMLNQLFKYEI